jgi:hypothetical protein
MPNAPPKHGSPVKPPRPPSGSGRSTRPIQRSSRTYPLWVSLLPTLPAPLLLLLLLLLQGCAKEPPRYVVVSANRGCSAVFKPFKKEEIEQATREARVKMEGHNAAWEKYCGKT